MQLLRHLVLRPIVVLTLAFVLAGCADTANQELDLKNQSNGENLTNQAAEALKAGDFERANQLAQAALATPGLNKDLQAISHYIAGYYFFRTSQLIPAERQFKAAMPNRRLRAQLLAFLSLIELKRRNYADAVSLAQQSIRACEAVGCRTKSFIFRTAAWAHFFRKDYRTAEAYIVKSLRADDSIPASQALYGHILIYSGRRQEARNRFERALKLGDSNLARKGLRLLDGKQTRNAPTAPQPRSNDRLLELPPSDTSGQ